MLPTLVAAGIGAAVSLFGQSKAEDEAKANARRSNQAQRRALKLQKKTLSDQKELNKTYTAQHNALIAQQDAVDKQIAATSKKVEEQRRLQMNLEGKRQIRQAIRQMVIGRSLALSNATNQGAGNSSGVRGGMAQVTAEGLSNVLGVNQSLDIGNSIFDLNNMLTDFGSQYNSIGRQISTADLKYSIKTQENQGKMSLIPSIANSYTRTSGTSGQMLANAGNQILNNASTIGSVGSTVAKNPSSLFKI